MWIENEISRLSKILPIEYLKDIIPEFLYQEVSEGASNLENMRSRVVYPKSLLRRKTVRIQKIVDNFDLIDFMMSISDCILYSENILVKVSLKIDRIN